MTNTTHNQSGNERQNAAPTLSPLLQRNVYISGLPTGFTSNNFRQLCQQFGKVEASKLCVDANSNPTKGYGFCLFFDAASAEACIKGLQGAVFGGRRLQARYADAAATPQPSATTAIPNPATHSSNGGTTANGASMTGGKRGSGVTSGNQKNAPRMATANAPQTAFPMGSATAGGAFFALPGGGFFVGQGGNMVAPAAAPFPTFAAFPAPSLTAQGAGHSAHYTSSPTTGNITVMPLSLSPPPSGAAPLSGPLSPLESANPLTTFSFYPPPMQASEFTLGSSLASQSQPSHQHQQSGTGPAGKSMSLTPTTMSVSQTTANAKANNHNAFNIVSPLSSYSLLSPSLAASSASSDPNHTQGGANTTAAAEAATSSTTRPAARQQESASLQASLELAPGYNAHNDNNHQLGASMGSTRTNPICFSAPLSDLEPTSPANQNYTAAMVDSLSGSPAQGSLPFASYAPQPPATMSLPQQPQMTYLTAQQFHQLQQQQQQQQQFVLVPMVNGSNTGFGGTSFMANTAGASPFFFAPSQMMGVTQPNL